MQPGFPELGTLYLNPVKSGVRVWTQPNGPGTPVLPSAPALYPPRYEGYPQSPFAYEGLFVFGCGHWTNTCEVYKQFDPYNLVQAAMLLCPVCGFLVAVVEPADDWWETFYSIYATGLEIATLPTAVE